MTKGNQNEYLDEVMYTSNDQEINDALNTSFGPETGGLNEFDLNESADVKQSALRPANQVKVLLR